MRLRPERIRAAGAWLLLGGLFTSSLACRHHREAAPARSEVAVNEIVYEVTGGFAGFDLTLFVRRAAASADEAPGDEAVVEERGRIIRSGDLGPEGWAGLEQLLAAADLPRLRSRYGREGAVSDAMLEVVTVRRAGDAVRVTALSDPGDEPPAEFRALTERLRELALTLPAR